MIKYIPLLVCSAILFSCNQKSPADFLIQNGTIVDGLGNLPFKGDVLIRNGKMELVKPVENVDALKTLDATGLVVAPGFVDVHNHTDWAMFDSFKRLNEGFIRQGVTTIVGGPDGYSSPSDIRKLIEAYNKQGIGTNVAFYVGHNGIRKEVMKKDQKRAPTVDELNQMKALVKEGMEMGAIGLSTGLMYEPGMYSNTKEVIALAKEVAPFNGIYDSHVRSPVFDWIASNQEVINIGLKANIPAKMGHLKAVGLINAGKPKELIKIVEKARKDGISLVSDQYPYDGAGGSITLRKVVIPSEDRELSQDFIKDQSISLKSFISTKKSKNNVRNFTENGVNGGFSWIKAIGYSSLRIVDSPDFPELVGRFIVEIAQEKNIDPFDLICDLLIDAKRPIQVKGGILEEDVKTILVQPWNMIASDGAYLEENGPKLGHPRSTGTFPRVLGRYVRDQKILIIEEAIRKMTSFPADFIGFPSRGRIQNGLPADIVIFNPKTIIDLSTYLNPNKFSKGVIHVFVNGALVLQDEKMTGNAPGKYLSLIKEANTVSNEKP